MTDQFWASFGDFGDLLGDLLLSYFTNAVVFFLLHLLVIGFIIIALRDIHSEVRALNAYDPQTYDPKEASGSAKKTTLLVVLLHQFVQDATRLGKQGIMVPLTDFSDRLDSGTEQISGKLRDYVSLLLTIGIAGTMFGVFEFAAGAAGQFVGAGQLAGERLAELLAHSMSKAFPVGFMGLILMFFFQFIASAREEKLRKALSKATGFALEARDEVSQSQADVIRESLAPLQNLERTLTTSFQPFVESFSENIQPLFASFQDRLEVSLTNVEEHFQKAQETSEGMRQATEGIKQSVEALQAQTQNLALLMQKAPAVIEKTIAMQEAQQRSINELHDAQQQSINALQVTQQQSIGELREAQQRNISEILERQQRSIGDLQETQQQSINEWQQTQQRSIGELHDAQQQSVSGFAERLDTLATQTSEAAKELSGVPQVLRETIKPEMKQLHDESLQVWEGMTNQFGKDLEIEYGEFLAQLNPETSGLTSSLSQLREEIQNAARELYRVANNWQSLMETKFMRSVEMALREATERVDQAMALTTERIDEVLMQRYPDATEKVEAFTEALGRLVGRTRTATEGLDAWLERVREAEDNLTQAQRIFSQLLDDMALQTNGQREDQVVRQLGVVTHVLEDIRDNAATRVVGPPFGTRRKKKH